MKVTNALVTWDDLSTMGLTAKGTPPTGLGIANKAELIAAYYVNEAASPFSTYTSDRCPPYQTIQNTTTTTTTISANVHLCVTNGAVFVYPVSAGNGSASGTLYNNSGNTVYIYGVFNSGGNSSGSVNADSGIVNGSSLTFSGTVTSSGQTILSNTQVALVNGAFVNWSLSKQDTLSSGATLRLGYALTIGGSVSNLSENCVVPPPTTTTTTTPTPTTTTTTTCNPTPNWVNNGTIFCSNCVSYQPQIDTNPCSATYNTTRNLNVGVGAPCNYSATWVDRDINTYYVCVGVDKYYQQIDTNPCSSTYNTTRTGALYQANSPSCGYVPPTTTTTTTAGPAVSLDWSVGNQPGGNLKVLSNTGATLLDITSSGGGAQSGVLTIYSYQQPYTIRGSWVSGSGNIIKYRVCDGTGEIFYSGSITNAIGSVDYTPSPVPLTASVALTAQNVTPPVCLS